MNNTIRYPNLDASIDAGEVSYFLWMIRERNANDLDGTVPDGWGIDARSHIPNTSAQIICYHRTGDGTEPGTEVTFPLTTGSESAIVMIATCLDNSLPNADMQGGYLTGTTPGTTLSNGIFPTPSNMISNVLGIASDNGINSYDATMPSTQTWKVIQGIDGTDIVLDLNYLGANNQGAFTHSVDSGTNYALGAMSTYNYL
jgi:hypothetical protein